MQFHRGRTRPRAIAWFGFTAFWGHLRHLVASAIATENIDSRQWMMPETPSALLDRCVAILEEGGAVPGPTLASSKVASVRLVMGPSGTLIAAGAVMTGAMFCTGTC